MGGNPLTSIDPEGLQVLPCLPCMGGAGGAMGAGGIAGWYGQEHDYSMPSGLGDLGKHVSNAWTMAMPSTWTGMVMKDSKADSKKKGTPCPLKAGNQDPCKGIRKKLEEHKRKLHDYTRNPMRYDNKGHLYKAWIIDRNYIRGHNKIYMGRIIELQRQISGFMKQLDKCERDYGKK